MKPVSHPRRIFRDPDGTTYVELTVQEFCEAQTQAFRDWDAYCALREALLADVRKLEEGAPEVRLFNEEYAEIVRAAMARAAAEDDRLAEKAPVPDWDVPLCPVDSPAMHNWRRGRFEGEPPMAGVVPKKSKALAQGDD